MVTLLSSISSHYKGNSLAKQKHKRQMLGSGTNLVVVNTGIGIVMSRVHCSLVDNDGGQVVHVIGHVNREVVLSDSVGQHVHGQREVDMTVHFFRRVRGVFITLYKCQHGIIISRQSETQTNL